jgi:ketosteroid isomerase-like protein
MQPDEQDVRLTVSRFNDHINSHDIDALAAAMTERHTFVDSIGRVVAGREKCLAAWQGFFAAFSDYRNVFEHIEVRGPDAVIAGRSVCSDARLNGPALWRAQVEDGRVAWWQVFDDTTENRDKLGIPR